MKLFNKKHFQYKEEFPTTKEEIELMISNPTLKLKQLILLNCNHKLSIFPLYLLSIMKEIEIQKFVDNNISKETFEKILMVIK